MPLQPHWRPTLPQVLQVLLPQSGQVRAQLVPIVSGYQAIRAGNYYDWRWLAATYNKRALLSRAAVLSKSVVLSLLELV